MAGRQSTIDFEAGVFKRRSCYTSLSIPYWPTLVNAQSVKNTVINLLVLASLLYQKDSLPYSGHKGIMSFRAQREIFRPSTATQQWSGRFLVKKPLRVLVPRRDDCLLKGKKSSKTTEALRILPKPLNIELKQFIQAVIVVRMYLLSRQACPYNFIARIRRLGDF